MTTKDIQQVLLNAPSVNVNGRKVLTHDGKHYGSYDHLQQELERQSRVAGQKNTMQALSSGQGIPLKSAGTGSNIGTAYGAELNGRQVAVVPGGWKNVPTGSFAEYEGNNWGYGNTIAEGVNVAGQTLFPMQRGDDLIFAPRSDSEPTLIEQQYGINANVPHVTPPTRARDAALEEMAQQYDPNYWDRKENEAIRAATLADADRTDGTVRVTSDMEGYEDRADIQAWLAAASPEIKEKFLADRARKAEAGLLQPNPNFTPAEVSTEDIADFQADYGGTPSIPAKEAQAILSGEGVLRTPFSDGEDAAIINPFGKQTITPYAGGSQEVVGTREEEFERAMAQEAAVEKLLKQHVAQFQ